MRIALITPYLSFVRNGNARTAVRLRAFLRQAGHPVDMAVDWDGRVAQAMVALHARRSHVSIARFAAAHPDRTLILVLTGTDLYRDIRFDADAQSSLKLVHRLVLLQEEGVSEFPRVCQPKTVVIYVIYQSATTLMLQPRSLSDLKGNRLEIRLDGPFFAAFLGNSSTIARRNRQHEPAYFGASQKLSSTSRILRAAAARLFCLPRFASILQVRQAPRSRRLFSVGVVAHLRDEELPFRAALALRHLLPSSRIRAWHVGDELQPGLGVEADALDRLKPRWKWLGGRPHDETRRRIAQSHLMVVPSRMDGGAKVMCEGATVDTPVLASDVLGNLGVLACQCALRAPLFAPEREAAAVQALLG